MIGLFLRAKSAVLALWPLVVVGVILGALLGLAVPSLTSQSVTATALIRIGQPVDPTQIMTSQAGASDSLAGYISGEIAYINDPGFSRSVSTDFGRPVTVTAVQNAQSPTITLSADQPSGDDAVQAVGAAITAYEAHVAEQAQAQGQAALSALDTVISELREQGGQSVRIEQLSLQRVAIDVQARRSPDVQVQQAPDVSSSASSPLLPGVGGALAGGLLALAIALAWRRASGVVTSRSAVDDEFDDVLQPTVELSAPIVAGAQLRPDDAAAARALYAQLAIGSSESARIALVGASGRSGSADVAALLTSVTADSADRITVVDAGSVTESTDLVGAIGGATHVIAVIGLGVDTLEASRTVRSVCAAQGATTAVVCTHRRWWRPGTVPTPPIADTPVVAGPTGAEPETVNSSSSLEDSSPLEKSPPPQTSPPESAGTPATDSDETSSDNDNRIRVDAK